MKPINTAIIRVISLDFTGTVIHYSRSIGEIYRQAALDAKLQNPPDAIALQSAFKVAFKEIAKEHPCYGFHHRMTERQWWMKVVGKTLQVANKEQTYSPIEISNYFRKVYQHFACTSTFTVYPDAQKFLAWMKNSQYVRGVLTNSPLRTVETMLPLLSYHNHFHYAVSCSDIGYEKPDKRLFDFTYEQAKHHLPDLKRDEILHIGDDFKCDFVGAREAGFQSLYLGNLIFWHLYSR